MNINLQKILFASLFLFLIIILIINNSFFQKKIIENYFNQLSIENNSVIKLDEIQYDLLSGGLYADLSLFEEKKNDTILHVPNLSFKLSLLDVFFSKTIVINKILIDSPSFNILEKSKNNKKSLFTFLSKINSLNRDITISEIKFNNTCLSSISTGQMTCLDLKLSDVKINDIDFSIQNILIKHNDLYINTDLLLRDSILFFQIDSALINTDEKLFNSFSFKDSVLNSSYINFSGDLKLLNDSIDFKGNLFTENSNLDIHVTKNYNEIRLNFLNIKLGLIDFNVLPKHQKFSKNIIFQGSCVFNDYASNEFKGYGTINMDYGEITYLFNKDSLKTTNLHVDLKDFNLGGLIDNDLFSLTNSHAKFKFVDNHIDDFSCNISNIYYNDYNYKNIVLSAYLDNQIYNIFGKISDDLVNAQFSTSLNKSIANNSFNFSEISSIDGLINYANLNALKFPVNRSLDFISTEFEVNNINIDSWSSNIKLKNFKYNFDNQIKFIDYFDLTIHEKSSNSMKLNLVSSIGNIIIDFKKKNNHLANLYCDVNLSKASVVSEIFSNQFQFDDILNLSILYDDFNLSHFNLKSPKLNYLNTNFYNVNVSSHNNNDLNIVCSIDSVVFSDKLSLNDFSLLSDITNNSKGNYNLTYSEELNKKKGVIKGNFDIYDSNLVFYFDKNSFINFSNKSWFIDSLSQVILDKKGLEFKDFSINLNQESLIVDGFLNKQSNLNFSFQKFALHHLNPFLPNSNMSFDGLVHGNIFYNKSYFPSLVGNFEVDEFTFNNVNLGTLNLNNSFNEKNDSLYSYGTISNKENIMSFDAQYPFDGTNYINAEINFNNFPIDVLDDLLNPISNLSGNTNGNIRVNGIIDNYILSGSTKTNNLNFNVPYLQQTYFNDYDTLETYFTNDSIIIQEFSFFDIQYQTEAVLNGTIEHKALRDMEYQLSIKTDSLFTFNTSKFDNNNYYGRGFLAGNMMINGNNNNTTLNIDAEAKDGSVVMIPLSKSRNIRDNQFIKFLNNELIQDEQVIVDEKSKFNMNFNLDIKNNSQIQLIFDEEIGDLIKGYGQGSLYLKINDLGDLEVFGDFIIEEGNYLFTLQDVITKSFQINDGGLIRFNGHPHNAKIDLDVLYNVQASLNPLNLNYDRQVKSPVICGMKMSQDLLNPDIEFFIDIPNSDQIIETSLETLTNTDQKLLEQFLYLLLANSFLIENDPSIDYLGNTLATTGTELLSNQLSNWLSQTTDAFDLGFKWVPGTGDSLSYQQVELAVSKKFLDDRVVVNGNVGTPPEQSQADIIGDLDIEYNFFKDGRLKLRVFNRAENYDPLSESLGYEQGFGIFFKKQFNSFRELFRRNKREKN